MCTGGKGDGQMQEVDWKVAGKGSCGKMHGNELISINRTLVNGEESINTVAQRDNSGDEESKWRCSKQSRRQIAR